MRHFPFHIGDYEAATAHLSPEEDLMYLRLMRVYYRDEKPIPADHAAAFRLVRAKSKKFRDAVLSVLEEFFIVSSDGYRSKKCDEVIRSFYEEQREYEEAKSGSRERAKRHRERRSEMFAALKAVGITPPWDISTAALEKNFRERCSPDCNAHGDAPVTVSVTAINPITNNQSKTPLPPKGGTAAPGISESDLSDPRAIEQWRDRIWKSFSLRRNHETLAWLNAAALRALAKGDDPVGMFISLAKEIAAGQTAKLENYYAEAKLRMIPGVAALAASNGVDHADEN